MSWPLPQRDRTLGTQFDISIQQQHSIVHHTAHIEVILTPVATESQTGWISAFYIIEKKLAEVSPCTPFDIMVSSTTSPNDMTSNATCSCNTVVNPSGQIPVDQCEFRNIDVNGVIRPVKISDCGSPRCKYSDANPNSMILTYSKHLCFVIRLWENLVPARLGAQVLYR
ncbi:hypothetical protein BDY19DRAFT_905647 [Irpex rosettiformis]|uniref:Uncharacterized protein n=1 Tax=Irpex rosettiformis TaxID=378272 RepID=A0ACB8U6U4_9APHY|nr:hypothetical protein BDY19DRAFT_905647 [Irpex rosettiformis]